MTFPFRVRDWRDRAEIDYIGPFVKAWAAHRPYRLPPAA